MRIAIVDYGMGNLHSVGKAVERLGYEGIVTGDEARVLAADGVLLPGVGAFGDAMEHLRASGLDAVVRQAAASGKPLLGICLGMQLLFDESEEHGRNEGLGLLPGRAVRFAGGAGLKVPHMGWNRLEFLQPENPLLAGLEEGHVYFVHSYHVLPERREDLLAVTDYGHPVTAIVGRGNVYGMQFHPEKSGQLGMALLRNFLALAERQAGSGAGSLRR
ncbi:imidazole glycerol phosphate synthase subunit HisH [Paenibacillus macerans]|uniref:imidazole glycerol phosphate synthase subunit HisH n=1 Tax=Paenibacillus macerans TaxID=44252 RepID=UPI000EC4B35F|nr:imidazole glycerol phosphate synthase subunit HisH [Paenibacillus macerans]MEC0138473.1 imidazole glycerol phosphate synthase subunit HisH [Paenibacillus macerans]MEC0330419.1 imidazole glycerol phosphate synthase subunit HisH [Paenibacillus macerans]GBK65937.1 imidazole glycerol phosphate synthase subunit HisH [Paenibacillus macerans]GBK72266.1 imidazole glycerol phosphate synthase subunit HisH [Paenibacillus macerans]GIP12768.1 imidazole glycerol phosphate synthase subunit HisH [Paenibaci